MGGNGLKGHLPPPFCPAGVAVCSVSASGAGLETGRRIFHPLGVGWVEVCEAFLPSQGGGGASFVPSEQLGASPLAWAGWSVWCAGRWWEARAAVGRQARQGTDGSALMLRVPVGRGDARAAPGSSPGRRRGGAGRSRPGPAGQSADAAVSWDGGLRSVRSAVASCLLAAVRHAAAPAPAGRLGGAPPGGGESLRLSLP